MLVRDLARRAITPRRHWPRALRNKWTAVALLAVGLFAYEQFDLWNLPFVTALIVLGYFAAVLLVDVVFKGASFCRYVCPIGQFNFVAATMAPFSLQVRRIDTCRSCKTVDCIKGRKVAAVAQVEVAVARPIAARGCELGLFLPSKVGNLDCTLCFDCVRACPHDNIGLTSRVPGEELASDERRSGIGRLASRPDLAALAVLFTFGGLLNAFAMTGTAAHLQHQWVNAGVPGHTAALVLLFVLALVIASILMLVPGYATSRAVLADTWSGPEPRTPGLLSAARHAARYGYALVPLGAGVWLAHYGFHLLAGVLAIVPVTQSAIIDFFGRSLAGDPLWQLTGVRPGLLLPFQVGCVLLGALGSMGVVWLITTRCGRSGRAALPWQVLVAILAIAAVWALAQPMDMRGMVMPG
jgi:ferredoxin